MDTDLKLIKKKYGEKMMHLCRSLFPTLLEQPGLLSGIMLSLFAPTKDLYNDIIRYRLEESFQEYVYNFIEPKEEKEKKVIDKTPTELLEKAGYDLYECKNDEEIQSFKKYYKVNEMLCTFRDKRLQKCHVFFAIKKNVDEIKRENFKNPEREDEYGTSVISIQFTKGEYNTLSIKNRYNHTVNNPDSTFSNNLDNIIEGLTDSFEKYYNLNLQNHKSKFYLPQYVKANDGKFYKYNYEKNNIYYCPNNIIIDNFEVIRQYQEKEKYLIIDYFIIDLVNKKIELYDKRIQDCFTDGIKNIEKINIVKSKETENKTIGIICKNNKIIIEIDEINKIIGYENQNLNEIGNYFLYCNNTLKYLNLPNLTKIGNFFLASNRFLKSLSLPKLIEIKDSFLSMNGALTYLYLPNLVRAGNDFLSTNYALLEIKLPKLVRLGANALSNNYCLKIIDLPNLTSIGKYFHNKENSNLIYVNLPKLSDNRKTELMRLAEKNKYKEIRKQILETKKEKRRNKRTKQRKHGK